MTDNQRRFTNHLLPLVIFSLFVPVSWAHHNSFPADLEKHPYYKVQKKHHVQASGKVYMGRPIAEVMGAGGVDWLERDEREEEERLSLLIKALDLKPGMKVADIGAGSGTISRLMAPRVLPKGTVFAVDIQKEMLAALTQKAKKDGILNITPILGHVDRSELPPQSVDLAIMVDVYHELSHPYEMMKDLSRILKPGGILALVEYRGEDPKVPIKELHKMTLAQIKKELGLKEFGLSFKRVDTRLPRQHLVFFEKTNYP